MKVTLLSYTANGDELAGQAAAVCTRSENYGKALCHAMRGGHESVIEHVNFTFRIEGVSRALLAQLTRHRIASFSVESQRYCDLGEMPMVIPPSILQNTEILNEYALAMDAVKAFYKRAVQKGIPKEDARYATPQSAVTNLTLTMNARELRHFFSLRCCNRAQWEIRAMADEMLRLCKEKCPLIFADAGPGCVRGNCPEEKPCGNPRMNEALFLPFKKEDRSALSSFQGYVKQEE